MSNKWEKKIPATNFNLENRRSPTAAVLEDGKRLMIVGGLLVTLNQKFSNQTIIYDTTTNTWTKGLSCTEPNRGTRQVYVFRTFEDYLASHYPFFFFCICI